MHLQGALPSVQVIHDALSCTFGSCSLCLVDCIWAILCVFLCLVVTSMLLLLSLSPEPDVMSALWGIPNSSELSKWRGGQVSVFCLQTLHSLLFTSILPYCLLLGGIEIVIREHWKPQGWSNNYRKSHFPDLYKWTKPPAAWWILHIRIK